MKKNFFKMLFTIFVVLILIVVFVKVNTDIYVGDYSWDCCMIDIQIKIDDKLLLSDSLVSNPYFVGHHLRKKLKYGIHTVQVSSKIANIKHETEILLLPNQYIYIDFLSADTLCLDERVKAEEAFPFLRNKPLTQMDSFFSRLDTVKFIEREKSTFLIGNRFNPFYLE